MIYLALWIASALFLAWLALYVIGGIVAHVIVAWLDLKHRFSRNRPLRY